MGGRRELGHAAARKLGLISPHSKDEAWGRRDLNPDRRVSPTRGATHACFANHGSALQSVITGSANPFAIKPMTGARNSTRLNYVPMGLGHSRTAAGISNFVSREGASSVRDPRSGVASRIP